LSILDYFRKKLNRPRRVGSLTLEDVYVKGVETGVLWDYRKDSIPVWNYIKTLQQLRDEILYSKKRYPEVHRHLKLIKSRMIADYESKINRIWNDQRTGTYFEKGDKFEPYQIVSNHNLPMWDGLTAFNEFIAGESSDFFFFMGAGIGTTKPTFADPGLEDEKVRTDMRTSGDINADGIVLKSTAAFPTSVPTEASGFSEFGAFDSDNELSSRMEYRVTITPALAHVQNVTFMQASHTIVLQAVLNVE
jgi:hypothetical protein